jgi:hypothetical protein
MLVLQVSLQQYENKPIPATPACSSVQNEHSTENMNDIMNRHKSTHFQNGDAKFSVSVSLIVHGRYNTKLIINAVEP